MKETEREYLLKVVEFLTRELDLIESLEKRVKALEARKTF